MDYDSCDLSRSSYESETEFALPHIQDSRSIEIVAAIVQHSDQISQPEFNPLEPPAVEPAEEQRPLKIGKWRRAELTDVRAIMNLYTDETYEFFGDVDLPRLIEQAHMSFCLLNEKSEVITFITLCDYPRLILPQDAWEEWISRKFNVRYANAANTLFIHLIVWSDKYFPACIQELFSQIYAANSVLDFVIITTPPFHQPFAVVDSFFSVAERPNETQPHRTQNVYLNRRSRHARRVSTRQSTEDDAYDLMAAVKSQSKKLFSIFGDQMIKDIFELFPGEKIGIVGQGSSLKDMGFLLCNTKVNYDWLTEVFDLRHFNGLKSADDGGKFLDPSIVVAEDETYGFVAPEESLSEESILSISSAESNPENEECHCIEKDIDEIALCLCKPLTTRRGWAKEKYKKGEFPVIGRKVSSTVTLRTSIRQRHCKNALLFRMKPAENWKSSALDLGCPILHPVFRGRPSAFTIEMLLLGPEQEENCCYDYIIGAFGVMRNYDYCLISLPPKYQMRMFLPYFYRLRCRTGETFPHDVYVTHRLSLFGRIAVRMARKGDLEDIVAMSRYRANNWAIQQDAYSALFCGDRRNVVIIFKIDDKIFGYAILCRILDIEFLRSRFDLGELMRQEFHGGLDHALVKHMQVSPLLHHKTRYILKEVIRLTGFTSLYTVVYPEHCTDGDNVGELSPVVGLSCWACVKPRVVPNYCEALGSKVPPENVTSGYRPLALYYMNARISSIFKAQCTARIVIVGAGDTALSFLEHLIFSRSRCEYGYSNITVIAPHGLPPFEQGFLDFVIPTNGRYNRQYLHSLGLPSWVSVVRGVMTAIDRREKCVIVDKDKTVYYSYLFLFCGEQFGMLPFPKWQGRIKCHIGIDLEDDVKRFLLNRPKNMYTINSEVDAYLAIQEIKNRLPNRKEGEKVLVYGHSLNAFTFINSLVEAGIPPKFITLFEPFPVGDFAVEVFNNPVIYGATIAQVKNIGVQIETPFNFRGWTTRKMGTKIVKVHFESHSRKISQPCMAFFCFAFKTIHPTTYLALMSGPLVYDGKLVIDSEFRTNDPDIYAAGPMTKYGRRYYAHNFCHEHYSSIEIGAEVAERFRERMEYGTENRRDRHTVVLDLASPVVVLCKLPGGVNYLNVRRPGPVVPLERLFNQKQDFGREIKTGCPLNLEESGYFRILLDSSNCVMDVTCYTYEDIDIANLVNLYGKHEFLLNHLVKRFDAKLIQDLYKYFREPWAYFLYHDRYPLLKDTNMRAIMARLPGCECSLLEIIVECYELSNWKTLSQKVLDLIKELYENLPELGERIKSNVLNFFSFNENHLTMFVTPNRIKELHDELSGSTLLERPSEMAGLRFPWLRPNIPVPSRQNNIFNDNSNIEYFHGTIKNI